MDRGAPNRDVTIATAIEAAGLAAALLFAIGVLDVAGAIGGALAMLAGRAAANLFLYVRERELPTISRTSPAILSARGANDPAAPP